MLKFMKASLDGKKILALLMSVVLAILILPAIPAQAATDTYEVGDYKGEKLQEEWTYPTQEGKVFAGWYADAEFTEVFEETTGTAYAKFVDANVLDLKKQLSAGASSISEKVSIRFLTGIDTLYYSNVTFHISIPDENKAWEWVETTAYSSILVDGAAYSYTAAEVFGEGAAYFVLHSLTGIPSTVFDKQFVVSVSWTTLDGTTVNTGDKTFTINELIAGLDGNLYVINTANELLAFNSLCTADNDYLAGKTVKLGADITLNEGNAADWASGAAEAPNNLWTPVNFSGTFDGQGHTISGLYVNSIKTYTGLFSTVNSGATVKNVKLVNSYIEGNGSATRSGVGSIAGRNHGTIDTVYSNAILKNNKQMTGGIVGMVTGAGENKITNCWFDGTITAINGTGGILGCSYGQTAAIEHCLNTGALNVTSGSQVGGLCGYAQGAANVTVSDSLNAGTLTIADGVTQIGTVVGAVADSATVTLTDTYGVQEFAEDAVGYRVNGTLAGGTTAVQILDDIKGYGAYQWTTLDFDGGTWVLKKDAVPVLAVFGSTDLSLEEAKKLPDYTWYDETAEAYVLSSAQQMHGYALLSQTEGFTAKTVTLGSEEYIITTAEQLLAFNSLCSTDNDYFKGKTVKLGADITLNEGNAADWASGAADAPNNIWTPVNFGGTFDGQGHTVRGLYVNSDNQYTGLFSTVLSGATVKNLRLVGSYIEGNGPETRSGVGSIAGRNHGTIDTVYTDAILKNSKQMTGGIAGMVTEAGGENKITNCWFDGTIYAINGTGGILGSCYGQTATIAHCLNTGELNVTSGSQVGGLCGYVQGAANVTISDSLNAGTLTAADGVTQIGTVVGAVANAATLNLTKVYGVQEFKENVIGWISTGTVTDNGYAVRALDDIKGYGAYQWTALDFDGGTWVLKDGAVPVLGAFGSTDLSLEEAKKLPDFSWYDETADTYVISTPRQLYGMNELAATVDYFAGKTVKLGADITLTGGSETTPNWTPITLSGIFDGQGHSLSGVYVKTTNAHNGFFGTVNSGAIVQNMKLVNSYIEGALTSSKGRNATGSIAGVNNGTIQNVYSSAIVKSVNGNKMTGGIAGMVGQQETGRIINCWFDGTVYGKEATAGILGGAYNATVYVQYCLNTGTVDVADGFYYAGGICGDLQNICTTTITDCLNAGTLNGTVKQSGTIIGRLDKADSTLELIRTYGASEFLDTAIGKQTGSITSEEYVNVKTLSEIQTFSETDLSSTYWTVREGKIPMLTSFVEWADSLGK